MGGKSFFCPIFSFLCKSRRYDVDDTSDWECSRPRYVSKIRSSDEDYGWWVGERDVDRKASDFINNFHQRKVAV